MDWQPELVGFEDIREEDCCSSEMQSALDCLAGGADACDLEFLEGCEESTVAIFEDCAVECGILGVGQDN